MKASPFNTFRAWLDDINYRLYSARGPRGNLQRVAVVDVSNTRILTRVVAKAIAEAEGYVWETEVHFKTWKVKDSLSTSKAALRSLGIIS